MLAIFAISASENALRDHQTNPPLALASACCGALVGFLFFKPFFEDWSGFWQCVRFWLTPDIISMFRGEWWEDHWGTFKLVAWLGLISATTLLAHNQLPKLLPFLFAPAP